MPRLPRVLAGMLVSCLMLGSCAKPPEPRPLNVFAAASLKESMDIAASRYRDETGTRVRVSYAGSSALARQIAEAAPADVFVCADLDWMDWLQQRGLVDADSRRELLGNTLVLVAPAASTAPEIRLDARTDLLPLLGPDGRIAVALTDSVPAGKYAKAALQSLGLWTGVEPHLAETENVRAALLLVARGEAPLGIVYGSDAKAEPKVKVLATFGTDTHPAIVYPVARVAASPHPAALGFVHWLQTSTARSIFREHGFTVR